MQLCAEAVQGEELVLDCGAQWIVSVLFASFGTPHGSCGSATGTAVPRDKSGSDLDLRADDLCHAHQVQRSLLILATANDNTLTFTQKGPPTCYP